MLLARDVHGAARIACKAMSVSDLHVPLAVVELQDGEATNAVGFNEIPTDISGLTVHPVKLLANRKSILNALTLESDISHVEKKLLHRRSNPTNLLNQHSVTVSLNVTPPPKVHTP